MLTVDELVRRLEAKPKASGGWMARCPAHEDTNQSLSIDERDGTLLLKCFAGCEFEDIVAALGAGGARNSGSPSASRWREVASYPYVDERGLLLFEVVRFEPKSFRQRRPDGAGGWLWNLQGVRRVLFHLPELIAAVERKEPAFIVEGEKDVLALESIGLVATCNPGGAGKWLPEYSAFFRGADIRVIADRDAPGRKHAGMVQNALQGIAASATVVEVPTGKDAFDYVSTGATKTDFFALLDDPNLHARGAYAATAATPATIRLPGATQDGADPLPVPAPFPLDALPGAVRDFAGAVAAAVDCAPDLPAVWALAALGAAAGSGAALMAKRGWAESGNLFVVAVAPPGAGKSPALQHVLAPLWGLNAELFKQYKEATADYEAELDAWSKAKGAAKGEKPLEPQRERVLTTDCTVESLARDLQHAQRGIVLAVDEASSWTRSLNAYKSRGGADRQSWLSLWNRSGIDIARKTSASVVVEKPWCAVIGATTPAGLRDVVSEDGKSKDDGFADRVLFSYPEPRWSTWTDAELTETELRPWRELILGIRERAPREYGLARPALAAVKRADAAFGVMAQEKTSLRGVLSKMRSHLLRLAVILHAVEVPEIPDVGADTIERASAICEYFVAHAERVRASLGGATAETDTAATEAAILALPPWKGTTAELLVALQRRGGLDLHVTAEALGRVVSKMAARGLIRRRHERGGTTVIVGTAGSTVTTVTTVTNAMGMPSSRCDSTENEPSQPSRRADDGAGSGGGCDSCDSTKSEPSHTATPHGEAIRDGCDGCDGSRPHFSASKNEGIAASCDPAGADPVCSSCGHRHSESAECPEAAPEPVAAAFVPTAEWQEVPAGVAVPPGLEFVLPMSGGPRLARLMPAPESVAAPAPSFKPGQRYLHVEHGPCSLVGPLKDTRRWRAYDLTRRIEFLTSVADLRPEVAS